MTRPGESPPIAAGAADAATLAPTARLTDVGPRLVTNQTTAPLTVYGEGLADGMELYLGPPVEQNLPLSVLDPQHAYTRLPADLHLPASQAEVELTVRLRGADHRLLPGHSPLAIVNDAGFPDLTALAISRSGRLFAISTTTDDLWVIDRAKGSTPAKVERLAAGDGPSALATWVDPAGKEWLLVGHRFTPELWLFDASAATGSPPSPHRRLLAPDGVAGLAVGKWEEAGDRGIQAVVYLSDANRNQVVALGLPGGQELWRINVTAAPGPLALAGDTLAVGCRNSGQVELLDAKTGASRGAIVPGPGAPIVGGSTKAFGAYVMGGSTTRALAWSPKLHRLFLASMGPNIGPNPQRMEVSANSGVAALDLGSQRYLRHLGFGAGVTQAVALDDRAGLLYAADVSLGVVRVLDATKLAGSDEAAAKALLQTIAIPPPEGFPTVRPAADFGIKRRAGVEVHSGPQAVALSPDGATLYVLDRFTGTLAILDVRGAKQGKAKLESQLPIVGTETEPETRTGPGMLAQRERRLGEILYFADVGRTGMSCDACHVEGGPGGLLFSKTHPLRIYRSPSVLGSRETPPYFNPASAFSLEQTAHKVGDRNRYHNPELTQDEIERLALYTGELAFPPNPFVGPDGAPPEKVELPDGTAGNPRRGQGLFTGKASCQSCHPAPEFTLDQDPATRNRAIDVGTPDHFPLRIQWQDPTPPGFQVPSLIGAWGIFPMLSSGTAGFGLDNGGGGEKLEVTTRFPMRAVLELKGKKPHGTPDALTPEEKNDLLAYLMTL
jgi:hypothetical protein